MLPFEPNSLRDALSSLSLEGAMLPEGQLYQRFYQLDIAQRQSGVTSHLGVFEAAGYQVVTQLWCPKSPSASLILMHGYYDHMGLYRHLIEWGLSMNYAVLACDLPGHGLSSGPQASINSFAEYQQVLTQLLAQAQRLGLPAPWHLCGQSTGGAILLEHLLYNQQLHSDLGRTILLAPLVRPRAWQLSKLTYQVVRHFRQEIARTFSDNSSDLQFLNFVRSSDPLQPKVLPTAWVGALADWVPKIENAAPSAQAPLIVQGEADRTVDWQHNLRVLQSKFSGAELLLLPEARHHLANESEPVRARYLSYLTERLAP